MQTKVHNWDNLITIKGHLVTTTAAAAVVVINNIMAVCCWIVVCIEKRTNGEHNLSITVMGREREDGNQQEEVEVEQEEEEVNEELVFIICK